MLPRNGIAAIVAFLAIDFVPVAAQEHGVLAVPAEAVTSIALQTPPQRSNAPTLTLRQAQDLAIKGHPRLLAAQDESAAAVQTVRENKAAYYPTVTGAVTAVGSTDDNARIGAGAISASRLISRASPGLVLSQLVTDLGRTPNLVASAKLQAQASEQNVELTREQVLLDVDNAYFGVLRSQAVLKTAQQTVDARQLVYEQANTLAQNNLRSQLDVSFADVNLSDAKLLLIQAQNNLQESYARLAHALGSDTAVAYQLADEPLPANLPPDVEVLVAQALAERPDVTRVKFERDAAYKFAYAERDLNRPSVSVAAVAGAIPYMNEAVAATTPENYAGAAVNVNVPVFNGGLYSARHAAAELRAQQLDQNLRDVQEQVAQDVRVAWANATTGYQRMDVTAQFLRSATLALDLAQGRYNLGLASIVELTQAQLNVTRAEIENLSAKYDYQVQFAGLQYAIGRLR
jgi:outer membrane protein